MRPHLDHLYRIAYRYTGQAADAEDLVQDLMIKLYPRLSEIESIDYLRPWLTRVLYNLFIDTTRHHVRTPLGQLETGDPFMTGNVLDSLHSEHAGPEHLTEQALTQERIQHAMNALSEENRALIAMHEMEGYSLNELQVTFDLPLGTLKSRLFRARQQLKSALGMEPIHRDRRSQVREVKKWTAAN